MDTTTAAPSTTTEFSRHAAQCRRLALSALPYDLVCELETLADEYDRRSAALRPVPRRHTVIRWALSGWTALSAAIRVGARISQSARPSDTRLSA